MPATNMDAGVEPNPGLLRWLGTHGVEYEVHRHPPTMTALETARAEGIDPRRFAKCLGVATDDGRRALVVVDAEDRLDVAKARHVLAAGDVRLLTEAELLELAPDCEIGTIPPVGELWGVSVFADFAIREDPDISFHAGSHRFTVHVDRAAWEHAAHVVYGDLAESDGRPAWALS
ncbi:MAG TPA: YbaK/EbsC family protein [Clostridia bacterium]|nr:YbaK/EbsC family protein [Clostridia bacterium]